LIDQSLKAKEKNLKGRSPFHNDDLTWGLSSACAEGKRLGNFLSKKNQKQILRQKERKIKKERKGSSEQRVRRKWEERRPGSIRTARRRTAAEHAKLKHVERRKGEVV